MNDATPNSKVYELDEVTHIVMNSILAGLRRGDMVEYEGRRVRRLTYWDDPERGPLIRIDYCEEI